MLQSAISVSSCGPWVIVFFFFLLFLCNVLYDGIRHFQVKKIPTCGLKLGTHRTMCTTSDVLKDLTTSLIVRTHRTVCYPQSGMMSWCQTAREIELHVWPMEQRRSRPRERAYSTLCAMWTICRHEANCPLYRAACTHLELHFLVEIHVCWFNV